METFISEHRALVWVVLVVLVTLLLLFLTQKLFVFLRKRDERKNNKNANLLKALRRVFRLFFILFGLGLISYVFLQKEAHELITQNLIRVIWITLVLAVTLMSAALSQTFFNNKIEQISRRDQQDSTTYKYLSNLATFSIYTFGIVLAAIAIPPLRTLATSALAGAGVFALIAGVAAQEGIANLVGGIFIVFFKPFRIGDVVRIGPDLVGRVEDLNLRHTVINNFQNKRIVIPNAVINKENITNYYLGEYKICEWIEVGISYDSSIDKAIAIMQEEGENHPHALDNRTPQEKKEGKPIVDVQVIGLGESSVNLRAWVWGASFITGFKMRNDLYKSIKQRFDQEGIEIPFPHRTLVFKNAISNH